jgi:hypothetical protein
MCLMQGKNNVLSIMIIALILLLLSFNSYSFSVLAQNSGESYEYIKKWGSFGESNGQFIFPKDITLDSNNDVYVTDFWNNIIQKFDSNGNFILKWGSEGEDVGQFISLYGIAVDSNNNIYVTDSANHRIQKFDSNGILLEIIRGRKMNLIYISQLCSLQ